MGSAQSHPSFRPQHTRMEAPGLPRAPPSMAQKGDAPPPLIRVESFSDKVLRKFSSQPLVPIGCAATAYFLVSGLKSFRDQDAVRSQKMMRARVGAQFVTLAIFMGYLGWERVDWRLAPSYQDQKQYDEEHAASPSSVPGEGAGSSEAK